MNGAKHEAPAYSIPARQAAWEQVRKLERSANISHASRHFIQRYRLNQFLGLYAEISMEERLWKRTERFGQPFDESKNQTGGLK